MIVFQNLKYSSCKLLTDIPLDKEGEYVVDGSNIAIKLYFM